MEIRPLHQSADAAEIRSILRCAMSGHGTPILPFDRDADERWMAEVKAALDLRRIVTNIARDGKALCPWHADETPSLHVYTDHVHCYACNETGDVFAYLMAAERLTFPQAKARAGEMARMGSGPTPKITRQQKPPASRVPPAPAKLPAPPPVTLNMADWCKRRHLDVDALREVWGVREGTAIFQETERAVFRYPTPLKVMRYRARDGKEPKTWWGRGGRACLYGIDKLSSLPAGPLYLVNGEPSVWACYQSKVRAICLCVGEGTKPSPKLIAELKAAGYSILGVVYDNDKAGQAGARNVVEALRAEGMEAHAYQLPADLGPGADVDDLHRRTGDTGLAAALADLPMFPALPPQGEAARPAVGPLAEAEYIKIPGHQQYTDGREIFGFRVVDGIAKRLPLLPWCPAVKESVYIPTAEPGRKRHYLVRVGEDEAWASTADLRSGEVWEDLSDTPGREGKGNTALLANLVLHFAVQAPTVPGVECFGWHQVDDRWAYVLPDGATIPSQPEGQRVHVVDVPGYLLEAYRARTAWPDGAPSTDADLKAAVWFMIAISPEKGYGLLALGAAARALHDALLPSGTTLILEGPPGHGKTGTAHLARGLVLPAYQGGNYEELSTGSFNDTATALEQKIARESSWPILVDDLALPDNATALQAREFQSKIDMVARSVFNHAPMRDRATRDLKPRPSRYVRSLPFLTAQSLPPDTDISVINRSVLLQVESGDIDTRLMARDGASHARALYALGCAIIGRCADRLNTLGKDAASKDLQARKAAIEKRIRAALADELKPREIPQEADRLPGNAAQVLLGLELLGEVFTPAQDLLSVRGLPAVVAVLVAQIQRMERKDGPDSAGPFTALMRLLGDRIARGVPISGGKGWRIAQQVAGISSRAFGDSDSDSDSDIPPIAQYPDQSPWPKHAAGWHDGPEGQAITTAYASHPRNALFLTETWRAEMRRLASQTPGCLGLTTDTALGRAAEKEGWLAATGGDGKRSRHVRQRGSFIRAWTVRLDMFLSCEGIPADGPEEGGEA